MKDVNNLELQFSYYYMNNDIKDEGCNILLYRLNRLSQLTRLLINLINKFKLKSNIKYK